VAPLVWNGSERDDGIGGQTKASKAWTAIIS
jgi:hypothetical protein